MYSRLYCTVAVQSSLKMVKMTSANKQQKPRKTRCKKCEDENFINAVQEATDESIQIMTDIKAIIQETNSGKSQQRSRDHDSRDRPDLSLVERTTEKRRHPETTPSTFRAGSWQQQTRRARRPILTVILNPSQCWAQSSSQSTIIKSTLRNGLARH